MIIFFNVGCILWVKVYVFFEVFFLLYIVELEFWGGGFFSFCGFYDIFVKKKIYKFF